MRHFFSVLNRAIAALLLAAGLASASPIDLTTPAGLNPGDKFRFIAVTPTTTSAASSDINSYNTFVQNAFGGATYGGVTITWKAIGSTAFVNARDNVGGLGSLFPVFKPFTGTKVADSLTTSAGGLWSGSVNASPDETLTATLPFPPANEIYTGSAVDGTKKNYGPGLGGLGETNAYFGWAGPPFTYSAWISVFPDSSSPPNTDKRMYGLSEELTVSGGPSPVPEIDPAGMGSVLALLASGLGLLERRRLARKTA